MRYVIPKDSDKVARPPIEGFILQESSTSIGSVMLKSKHTLEQEVFTNSNEQRNFRFISGASWSGSSASIDTELPHNLEDRIFS